MTRVLRFSQVGYLAVTMGIVAVGCAAGDAAEDTGVVEPPIGAGADDASTIPTTDAARADARASTADGSSVSDARADAASDATSSIVDGGVTTPDASTGPDACSTTLELCNAKDDNCNSRIDEGCPQTTALGATESSPAYGGGGGSAFDGACPAGQALVGFQGRSGDRLDNVQNLCAPIYLEAVVYQPELEYRVRTQTPTLGASHGGTGGSLFTDKCANDEVVIGLGGRSGSGVDMLAFSCGSVTMRRTAGVYAPAIAATTTSATHGGTGGGPLSYACGAGRVATGLNGRSGDKVDAMSLTCALIAFTTQQ